jgi:glycosyltransferase involved in cell wall biosynthesis
MHIAMVGCRGIPATYGGVEKAVEELAVRLVRQGHEVTVLCRSHYTPKMSKYENVRLVRLPTIREKHLEMIVHTVLSALYLSVKPCDLVHVHSGEPAVVVPFLPLVRPSWPRRTARRTGGTSGDAFQTLPGWPSSFHRRGGQFADLSMYHARRTAERGELLPNGVTPRAAGGLLQQFEPSPTATSVCGDALPKVWLLIDAYTESNPA